LEVAACALLDLAERFLRGPADVLGLVLDQPIQLEIGLGSVPMADLAAVVPGVDRAGPRTVRVAAPDPVEMWRYFRVIVTMAGAA